MAHCIECGELEEHDMDCSQHPAADNSGLHIYRLGDVEALRSENMKLRSENKPLREDNERVMNLFRWSEENCTRAKLLRLVTVQDGQLQELCAVLASAPEPWQPSRISAREWDAVYCGWYRLTAEWRRSDDIR